jgi:hypothetical protein
MKNVVCLFPTNKNPSLATTGYTFWHNLFANMRPLHKTEMEVSLIITHMDDCSTPFKGMCKTKCDVWHTERVYYPLFTIVKFNTSISPTEMDLVSFTILPLQTIIISYISTIIREKTDTRGYKIFACIVIKKCSSSTYKRFQHAKHRVKYWLKLGEVNLIKVCSTFTYKTAIPYKSYAFEHLLQCLELNQTGLFECSPLKFVLWCMLLSEHTVLCSVLS